MNFLKKTTTLLFALLLSASFAACGGDSGNSSSDSSGGGISYSYFTSGTGDIYDRYEGVEGYYEITLTAGQENYYSFAIEEAGQYALVTLAAKDGLTIERYDATAHYVTPTPYPAEEKPDGTLYSYVYCSPTHFNSAWRATYKIASTVSGVVTIRFMRVGEALKEPENYVTDITAQELVGKAQDFSQEYVKTAVPWTISDQPQYFYDEDYEMTFIDLVTGEEKTATGFYRYGSESDENAPVIWAAITTASDRYIGAPFSEIQYQGNNLTLHVNTDKDGNHYFNSYVDFIMNNGGLLDNTNNGDPVPGDNTMLCYMNATNKDGLFPVNQELFDFLSLYTSKQSPFFEEGVMVNAKDYWLAPCYYYEEAVLGSQNNPYILSAGENNVTLEAKSSVFYKIEAEEATQYTVTFAAGLISVINTNHGLDGQEYTLILDVPAGGLLIELTTLTTGTYVITIA